MNEIMARKNDIGMHSTHNEGKSVIAQRLIRTLENKTLHDFSFKKCLY